MKGKFKNTKDRGSNRKGVGMKTKKKKRGKKEKSTTHGLTHQGGSERKG